MIGIRHTGIVVSDADRSIQFYKNLLGFQIKKDQVEEGSYIDTFLGIKDVQVRTVKMQLQNEDMIELLQFHSHPSEVSPPSLIGLGCTHVAFSTDGAWRTYVDLQQSGATMVNKPTLSADGRALVFFCKDPDGTWLEIVEEK